MILSQEANQDKKTRRTAKKDLRSIKKKIRPILGKASTLERGNITQSQSRIVTPMMSDNEYLYTGISPKNLHPPNCRPSTQKTATKKKLGSWFPRSFKALWYQCLKKMHPLLARSRRLFHFSRYALGIVLILMVALLWTGSSLWIQHIYGDLNYNKPYFLTYFTTLGFSLWNIFYLFNKKWRKLFLDYWHTRNRLVNDSLSCSKKTIDASSKRIEHISSSPIVNRKSTCPRSSYTVSIPCSAVEEEHVERQDLISELPMIKEESYTLLQVFCAVAIFCPLRFLANSLFNASLAITNVSTTTIISSSSSIWTFLLSLAMLKQKARIHHIIAVLLSVGGSVLVGLSNSNNTKSTWSTPLGIAEAGVSAFFYAVYTVTLKKMLPDEKLYSMGIVFGLLGILSTLVFWPGLLILHYANLETFVFPSRLTVGALIMNTLVGTSLADVLWARSVVLTSPLVATLGLTLTIPLAMLFDFCFKAQLFNPLYIGGATTVAIGFVLCNL